MKRVIVSGGGTGGHIYPAVAVAEALRRRFGEEVEILFVGAEGKMARRLSDKRLLTLCLWENTVIQLTRKED